jgi:hypothetical protein
MVSLTRCLDKVTPVSESPLLSDIRVVSVKRIELETPCITVHNVQYRNECMKLLRIHAGKVGDASLLRGYRGHPHLARPPSS